MQTGPDHANFKMNRRYSTPSHSWKSAAWHGGAFDMGARSITAPVEGELSLPHLTFIATLSGGTEATEVWSETGHSYKGADYAGAISMLPGGLQRRSILHKGQIHWASIALTKPTMQQILDDFGIEADDFPEQTNIQDTFVLGLIRTLAGEVQYGGVDALLGEAASTMLARHAVRHYAGKAFRSSKNSYPGLTKRSLAKVQDYVMASLDQPIRLADMAQLAGISVSHFSRAFKESVGISPYAYVVHQRLLRAQKLLRDTDFSITEVALECGFSNSSRFSELFHREVGMTPSQYAREAKI